MLKKIVSVGRNFYFPFFLISIAISHSEHLALYRFQEYVSTVFYGDLVYKISKVRGSNDFIASITKIVKRLRRRQYDPEKKRKRPGIIEKTGLVLGPFTACTLS